MISEGSALKEEKKAEPIKENAEKNNVINLEIEKKKEEKNFFLFHPYINIPGRVPGYRYTKVPGSLV